jgi:Fic family protein
MIFQDRTADIDKLKSEIDVLPSLLPMLKEYYRIGLTYSSNALEGNTLTETETKVIIEDGLTIGGKTMREHLEVLGHSQGYDLMWNKAHTESTFSEADICALHHLFYFRIDEHNAGTYRTVPVFISGTDFEFPKPSHVPTLMSKFMQEIVSLKQNYHPVHMAALIHAQFVTIHPFIDGNGRTARLLMNLVLIQNGYPITIIPPMMRSAYIHALQQTNKQNHTPFLHFISEMVYESSKEYLRLIKSAQ